MDITPSSYHLNRPKEHASILSALAASTERGLTAKVSTTIPLDIDNLNKLIERIANDTLPQLKVLQQKLVSLKAQQAHAQQVPMSNTTHDKQIKNTTIKTELLPQLARLNIVSTGRMESFWALLDMSIQKGETVRVHAEKQQLLFTRIQAEKTPGNTLQKQDVQTNQNTITKTILNEALRHYLPKQDNQYLLRQLFQKAPHNSAITSTVTLKTLERTLSSHAEIKGQSQNGNQVNTVKLESNTTNNPTHYIKKQLINVLQQVSKLRLALPQLQQLQAHDIKTALLNSGSFLENKLAHNIPLAKAPIVAIATEASETPSFDIDIKRVLLQTLALIQQLPPYISSISKTDTTFDALLRMLLKEFEPSNKQLPKDTAHFLKRLESLELSLHASLAKITSNQLQALQTQTSDVASTLQYMSDLFFRLGDQPLPVHIQLFDDAKKQAEKKGQQRSWRLTLQWEFPEHGLFSSEIRWSHGRVSTKLWAESPELRLRFREHLPELRSKLEKEGIVVESLHCVDDDITQHVEKYEGLIDVRT